MTIWQCDLKDLKRTLLQIESFLNGDAVTAATGLIDYEKNL